MRSVPRRSAIPSLRVPGGRNYDLAASKIMDEEHADLKALGTERSSVQKSRAEKLDSLSKMAGGIAHDFNNLLLAIMGNADLLDQDLRAGRDGLTSSAQRLQHRRSVGCSEPAAE